MALPWSFVSKITNSKHPAKKTAGRQIPNKLQTTSTPPKRRRASKFQGNSKVCYFEFRSPVESLQVERLRFICNLIFVIWNLNCVCRHLNGKQKQFNLCRLSVLSEAPHGGTGWAVIISLSSIEHPVSSIQYPISSIKYQASSTA